jgi:hypothetical protein
MSDYVIKLFPKQPEFEPSMETYKETEVYIKSISKNYSDIQLILKVEIRFIDQGSNFESISCPFCHNDLSIEWWSEVMEEASEFEFTKLHIKVPCCKRDLSLNDLKYNWNAGFARFSIEFHNPITANTENITREIEDILSCTLKKVVAHY